MFSLGEIKLGTLALGCLLVGGCATTAEGMTEGVLPGCYYFEQNAEARQMNLPWGIMLTQEKLEGWPPLTTSRTGVKKAVTLQATGPQDFPFGYWDDVEHDGKVEIGYPAMGGFVMMLEHDNGTLRGSITPLGDALPLGGKTTTRTSKTVSLTRAQCPDYITIEK